MSRDNLGSKQTIILHNCLIQHERCDLLITPHKQTVGYIRSKRQTRKNNHSELKQIFKRRFSKTRNAVSESDTTTIQQLQDLKDSIDKNNPANDHKYFSESEFTTLSLIKCKRRILKKSYFRETLRLYNDNIIGINQKT